MVTIDDWVRQNKDVLLTVARAAAGEVADRAQVAKGKEGGRMPVKTGFLRASGQSSLLGMPYGPQRGEKNQKYPSEDKYTDTASVGLDLANMKLGDTFYFGWTAEYAATQEAYNGFLDTQLQDWQQIVDDKVAEVKRRSGK